MYSYNVSLGCLLSGMLLVEIVCRLNALACTLAFALALILDHVCVYGHDLTCGRVLAPAHAHCLFHVFSYPFVVLTQRDKINSGRKLGCG